jgi:hypothetical protein
VHGKATTEERTADALFWSVQMVSRSRMSKLMFQGMGLSAAALACSLLALLPSAHTRCRRRLRLLHAVAALVSSHAR